MDNTQIMTQARFWNKVKVIPQSNSSQCWEWQGATMPNGYGIASIGNGQTMLAHRYAASLSNNIQGQVVMHSCDNPKCVRPDHLIVGTQKGNIDDMIIKERKHSKLSIINVKDIRSKRLSRVEFAKLYNISEYTVGEIQRKNTWAWVK